MPQSTTEVLSDNRIRTASWLLVRELCYYQTSHPRETLGDTIEDTAISEFTEEESG